MVQLLITPPFTFRDSAGSLALETGVGHAGTVHGPYVTVRSTKPAERTFANPRPRPTTDLGAGVNGSGSGDTPNMVRSPICSVPSGCGVKFSLVKSMTVAVAGGTIDPTAIVARSVSLIQWRMVTPG